MAHRSPGTSPSQNRSVNVVISRKRTVGELRAAAAEALDTPIDMLILVQPGGDEFKDDAMALTARDLDWFAGIYARHGRRLMADEVRVTILRPSDDHKTCVVAGETVLSRKSIASEVALQFLPNHLIDTRRARVRHMVKRSRPGTICTLGETMQTSLKHLLVDGCELLVQELLVPESYEKGDVGILLRRWLPAQTKLAPPTELFVKQEWEMVDVRQRIREREVATEGDDAAADTDGGADAGDASATLTRPEAGEIQIVRPWAYQLSDVSSFKFCNWFQPGFRKIPRPTDAVADPDACGKWTLAAGDVLVWRLASASTTGETASDALPPGGKEVGVRIQMD